MPTESMGHIKQKKNEKTTGLFLITSLVCIAEKKICRKTGVDFFCSVFFPTFVFLANCGQGLCILRRMRSLIY